MLLLSSQLPNITVVHIYDCNKEILEWNSICMIDVKAPVLISVAVKESYNVSCVQRECKQQHSGLEGLV